MEIDELKRTSETNLKIVSIQLNRLQMSLKEKEDLIKQTLKEKDKLIRKQQSLLNHIQGKTKVNKETLREDSDSGIFSETTPDIVPKELRRSASGETDRERQRRVSNKKISKVHINKHTERVFRNNRPHTRQKEGIYMKISKTKSKSMTELREKLR